MVQHFSVWNPRKFYLFPLETVFIYDKWYLSWQNIFFFWVIILVLRKYCYICQYWNINTDLRQECGGLWDEHQIPWDEESGQPFILEDQAFS